jgi:hypothetical protein
MHRCEHCSSVEQSVNGKVCREQDKNNYLESFGLIIASVRRTFANTGIGRQLTTVGGNWGQDQGAIGFE